MSDPSLTVALVGAGSALGGAWLKGWWDSRSSARGDLLERISSLEEARDELAATVGELREEIGELKGARTADAAAREQLERDLSRVRRQRNRFAAELERVAKGEASNPSVAAARALAEISDADEATSSTGPISYDDHDLAEIAGAIAAREFKEGDL